MHFTHQFEIKLRAYHWNPLLYACSDQIICWLYEGLIPTDKILLKLLRNDLFCLNVENKTVYVKVSMKSIMCVFECDILYQMNCHHYQIA